MKYFTYFYIIVSVIVLTLFSQTAYASTTVETDVKVETNTGNNTICQNGRCTTTSNNGNVTSKVCVNGKCFTDDGDIDYESEDGTTKIQINNSGASSNSSKSNTDTNINVETNTLNKQKEIEEEKEGAKQKIDDQKNKINEQKKKIKEDQNALQKLIDQIKHFFENLNPFKN